MMNATLIGRSTWGKTLIPYIEQRFNLISVQGKGYEIPSDTDVVFIATPPNTHYDIAKECLLKKKHVFCEKPLAMRHGDCVKLAYLARKMDRVLYTDYLEMTAPSRLKMVELSKKIGQITKFYAETQQNGKFTNYSVAWQLASHQLSVASLFFDLSKINFSIEKFSIIGKKNFDAYIIRGKNNENEKKITLVGNRRNKIREKKYLLFTGNNIIKYRKQNEDTIVMSNKKLPMCMSERYNFDEDNNIQYSIDEFIQCIETGKESNIEIASRITKILEGLHI